MRSQALPANTINAVAAHLPWVVCLNRGVVAEGPPNDVFTPEVLKRTYDADIHVTQYQGMTLVAESPHFFGRGDRREGRDGPGEHQE